MKALVLVMMMVVSLSATSQAASRRSKPASKTEKICAALQDLADEDCTSLMCDDLIADGTFANVSDCVGGSDYAEAAQATCEETMPDRVAEYNSKHPHAQVSCEE